MKKSILCCVVYFILCHLIAVSYAYAGECQTNCKKEEQNISQKAEAKDVQDVPERKTNTKIKKTNTEKIEDAHAKIINKIVTPFYNLPCPLNFIIGLPVTVVVAVGTAPVLLVSEIIFDPKTTLKTLTDFKFKEEGPHTITSYKMVTYKECVGMGKTPSGGMCQ